MPADRGSTGKGGAGGENKGSDLHRSELIFGPSDRGRKQTNWDLVSGNRKQFCGKIKEKWEKVTDEYFNYIGGKRKRLLGRLQECYGIAKDKAEDELQD